MPVVFVLSTPRAGRGVGVQPHLSGERRERRVAAQRRRHADDRSPREQRVRDRLPRRDRRDAQASVAADPLDPDDIVGVGTGEPAQHVEAARRDPRRELGLIVAGGHELGTHLRKPLGHAQQRVVHLPVVPDTDRALAVFDHVTERASRFAQLVDRGGVGSRPEKHAAEPRRARRR